MPVISSQISCQDTVGSWKARWDFGRMSYIVPPGLYALGSPDENSHVVVTANYKMTYDLVRKALAGRDLWLLVLETYGINVWCAAGKGTFGTGELVRRVGAVRLSEIVTHRELILPLFGAAGVKGIEILRRCGFKVRFSTIRIEDLPEFLDRGKASGNVRELTFTAYERVILTPIELQTALRKAGPFLPLLFLAAGFFNGSFSLHHAVLALLAYFAAVISGAFISPLLLPWLPSPAFSIKGGVTGLVIGSFFSYLAGVVSPPLFAATTLMIAAFSSFLMLNFTGSTPYTSRSGVKKEMRWALPAQALCLVTGFITILIWRFL
ncbi:MAG: acetyl-CoA synthase subunit gamma [Geobacteraceae bacterium]|nr:acetyl-CoA synthase subunit gamma [Geobacteraceae bacterium]